jgi:hypothetical protein
MRKKENKTCVLPGMVYFKSQSFPFPKMKKQITSISGRTIAGNVTREEAIQISEFARRALYWGDEYIGEKYLTPESMSWASK